MFCGFTQNGNPGFISESTGEPANLFHVVFEDQLGHPYASILLDTQDFEEYEIIDKVLPEDVSAVPPEGPKKRRR